MKVIASIGASQIDLFLNFVENKPLIIMDDDLHQRTVIVGNEEITTGFNGGPKIEYKLKDLTGSDVVDPVLDIVNIATIPNYFTKGKLDLIYIPKMSVLALIPNVSDAITNNIGKLELDCISIGGIVNTDSNHPNVSMKHSAESIIKLANVFTGITIDVNVNNLVGSVAGNNGDPITLTNYLTPLVGEIILSGAAPVLNITITDHTGAIFTETTYPASVLYNKGLVNLKLKHLPSAPKTNKYVVILS